MIDGRTLIEWGFVPGETLGAALREAKRLERDGLSPAEIREAIRPLQPPPVQEVPLRTNTLAFGIFIEPETEDEVVNTHAVIRHMDALMRVPTIVKGAIMPDACPSSAELGTIPVGGVVATKNAIHPGFHSADICCSMAISVFKRRDDVAKVLDAAMQSTHFGPGKRPSADLRAYPSLTELVSTFTHNPFLKGLEPYAIDHFLTQGDGNHFLYVGEQESSGQMALVTHHGSRGLGAQLYKRGKQAAERHTRIVAPRVPLHNAWIEADSQTGEDYWTALQVIRQWTKMNHYAIHDLIARRLGNAVKERFWNEHNFVFRRDDGLFYHGKGATPSYAGFAGDDQGMTLIPLNMAQPILIAEHGDNAEALGFSPHGAGRNLSRTAHVKRLVAEFGAADGLGPEALAAILARETGGLDIRFYTGAPDVSELPSAYKNAAQVQAQIARHGLAAVVDRILPWGSIMAGEMNWNRRR